MGVIVISVVVIGVFFMLKSLFSRIRKPPLFVKIESMSIYASGPERRERYYGPFPQRTTRYIWCDTDIFVNVMRWQPFRTHTLSYRFCRPDGSVLYESIRNLDISFDTAAIFPRSSFGYGWREPGHWPSGKYQAQVLLDGVTVATRHFTIEPPPLPKLPDEPLQHPRVLFYASGRETIRFPQQTTREVLCELTVRNLLYGQQGRNYPVTVQCSTVEGRLLWESKPSLVDLVAGAGAYNLLEHPDVWVESGDLSRGNSHRWEGFCVGGVHHRVINTKYMGRGNTSQNSMNCIVPYKYRKNALFQACVLSIVSRRLVLTAWMYLRVVSFFLCPKTFCKSAMDMPLLTLCALNVCRRVCTPDFLTPAFV